MSARPDLSRADACERAAWRWPFAASATLAIMAAVLVVYWPVRSHPFVTYDDPLYVSFNTIVQQGLVPDNVKWAFTTFHAANWHPLTWLSHMLDCQVFGPKAAGAHHMVNVALHALNAAILFVLLRWMTGAPWRSAIVALLFAVHPLRVESVAWLAERKEVLSTLFGLLAIAAYWRYTERRSIARYLLVMLAMALSLMAKPMFVTLPALLLAFDLWPLRRVESDGPPGAIVRCIGLLALEKLPLLALSIASACMTMYAQRVGGAVASLEIVPWSIRLTTAVTGIARYVQLTLWPRGLAVLHPMQVWSVMEWLPALGLICIVTFIALWQWWSRPWLLAGWLWFVIALVPVIGLVKVGSQSIADRYTYVPSIGLTIMLVWLAAEALMWLRSPWLARAVGAAMVIAISAALMFASRAQVAVWRDSATLFRHAIAVTGPNWVMHNSLGTLLAEQGDYDGAQVELRSALALMPGEINVMNNLAALLIVHPDPAKRNAAEALRLAERACGSVRTPAAHMLDTLAAAYAAVGRFDDAVGAATEAHRVALASGNLGLADQIAAKIPRYRSGEASHTLYMEGVTPTAQAPTTQGGEDG